MKITIELSKDNYTFPTLPNGQTTFLSIPEGKTKMLLSDIKSKSETFYFAINFHSKKQHDNINKMPISVDVLGGNGIKFYPNGTGYARQDDKHDREINLKYNSEDYVDSFCINLNRNTIEKEHSVSFTIDFI